MIETLIDKLLLHNIRIELVDNDKLKIHTDINEIPPELLTDLKSAKEDLVSYLKEQQHTAGFRKIPKAPVRQGYTLSSSQRRLWILSQLEAGNAAYNIPGVYNFNGHLELPALEKALFALLERHEILRTVFREDESGEIRQFVLTPEQTGFHLNYKDLRKHPQQEQEVRSLLAQSIASPFDLAAGPLFRASIYQTADDCLVFSYVMHHIISDAWSMEILIRELLQLYNAFAGNKPAALMPLDIHYKDYAVWQQQLLNDTVAAGHRTYWMQQFAGELPVLALQGDKLRPAVQTFNGKRVSRLFRPGMNTRLKDIAREERVTQFMVLMAAVNVLLYRYSNQDDIIIGSPVAGRGHADLENQIGFYINTLALRTRLKGTDDFSMLLQRTKEVVLGAFEHQDYPFDQLVDDLKLQRDRSRNALFDVSMTLQESDAGKTAEQPLSLGNVNISVYEGRENLISKFDLLFVFSAFGEEMQVTIEYNSDIYHEATVSKMAAHLSQLLDELVKNKHTAIGKVDFFTTDEREQLLTGFNNTAVDYPADNIITLFEKQVANKPDAPAVVFAGNTFSYIQLEERVNKLSNYLAKTYLITPDKLIGIMLDRSDNLIVAILAVLKCGAAYVPIDPVYPASRKEFIATETGIDILITQTDYIFDIDFYKGEIFAIDIQLDTLDTSTQSPAIQIAPENLAYVIYTSGSTGEPKGVMIEHRAIINTIRSQQEIFNIGENERGLQFASASFDAAISEIFIILLAGGTLFIIEEGAKKDPWQLEQFIKAHDISIATIPPAFLQLMEMPNIRSLKKLITAGEAAIKNKAEIFSRTGTYYNAYGPTESSICATVFSMPENSTVQHNTVPIGIPIANTRVYILNESLALCPVGVVGEIYISGSGLARGYLHKPALTAEKFIPNPYRRGTRMYKSGDLGKWLPDGNIEFLGRADNQVKLNGYRIELEEIEHIILQQPAVKEATVIIKDDSEGGKHLVAYYVAAGPGASMAVPDNSNTTEKKTLYELSEELSIYAYNKKEASFLFEEIFRDKTYLQHGITIPDNGCIIDVGANIGMFSIYAGFAATDVKVYAFEPLPPVFELLSLNASLYKADVEIFNIGLSSKEEAAVFTYFPGSTALSTRYAQGANVKDTVRQYIHNTEQLSQEGITDDELESLLQNHLVGKEFECRLKTLSQIIAEKNIERISLLKIDVEKAELDVLEGITTEDWQKIDQIVLEVHDINNRLETIIHMLTAHGFETSIDQHADLIGTELYNVYAIAAAFKSTNITATGRTLERRWVDAGKLKEQLREQLRAKLPSYMIPGHFIKLKELPLTTNGKIDRKRLPDPEGITLGTVTYVAPGNEMEQLLVTVCEEVLKKTPIGIKDDFFALGGDSIKSIQIVSRLKQRGYTLTIQDVMQHAILEQIAQHISVVTRSIEQGIVEGFIPLSPVQAEFLNSRAINKHHFNQSVLLLSKTAVSEEGLRAVLDKIVLHHDVLRMVYRQTPEGWVQENKGATQGYGLEVLDYTSEADFVAHCERIQSSGSLENGPLFRTALFRGSDGDRLLLVIHHLVTDGVSWRILFDDLSALYQQYIAGEPLVLPLKTDAFKYWQQKQLEYAASETLLREDAYWSAMDAQQVVPLPVDHPNGANLLKEVAACSFSLDEEQTNKLLTQCYKAYHTEINDILLTAFSLALTEIFGIQKVLVKLEGHGRENIGAEVDVTRTVGWFTAAYPVLFDMTHHNDIIRQLVEVKESLHRIPNKGIGYGVLKFLAGKDYRIHPPISFNYLGDFGAGVDTDKGERIFEFSGAAHGKQMSEDLERETMLDASGKIVQGTLRLSVAYSTGQYSLATIESLMAAYRQKLIALIEQLSAEEKVHLSPVDLTYKGLSLEQLEMLNKLSC